MRILSGRVCIGLRVSFQAHLLGNDEQPSYGHGSFSDSKMFKSLGHWFTSRWRFSHIPILENNNNRHADGKFGSGAPGLGGETGAHGSGGALWLGSPLATTAGCLVSRSKPKTANCCDNSVDKSSGSKDPS